jgi:hypothetical protein
MQVLLTALQQQAVNSKKQQQQQQAAASSSKQQQVVVVGKDYWEKLFTTSKLFRTEQSRQTFPTSQRFLKKLCCNFRVNPCDQQISSRSHVTASSVTKTCAKLAVRRYRLDTVVLVPVPVAEQNIVPRVLVLVLVLPLDGKSLLLLS